MSDDTIPLPALPTPDATVYGPNRTVRGHAILSDKVREWGREAIRHDREQRGTPTGQINISFTPERWLELSKPGGIIERGERGTPVGAEELVRETLARHDDALIAGLVRKAQLEAVERCIEIVERFDIPSTEKENPFDKGWNASIKHALLDLRAYLASLPASDVAPAGDAGEKARDAFIYTLPHVDDRNYIARLTWEAAVTWRASQAQPKTPNAQAVRNLLNAIGPDGVVRPGAGETVNGLCNAVYDWVEDAQAQAWEAPPAPHRKTEIATFAERAITDIESMHGRTGPTIQLRGWIRELSTISDAAPAAVEPRGAVSEVELVPFGLWTDVCGMFHAAEQDWKREGCWTEWDQSVRDRVTRFNIEQMERRAAPTIDQQPAADAQERREG